MKVTLLKNKDEVYEIYNRLSSINCMNVFQSRFYYELLNSSNHTTPKVLIAEDNDLIQGIVLIQIQNYYGALLKTFSSRAIISGGPLFNKDETVLSLLLSEYNNSLSKSVVYTQIRNLFNIEKYDNIFKKHNYHLIGHLNYLIDLNENISTIWDNVYSKRKNEIRKGVKEGVLVKEINYESEFSIAYEILELIYKKARLPLPEYKYFYKARLITGGDKILRVFGGYVENKLVGVMFALCFNDVVYNWYAASNPEYYRKYPNDVITWEVIKWASENGFRTFDFGGAGNPEKDYGVRDFKKKFGGLEVNYGRYECIHKPIVLKVSEKGFKLWQKVK